MIESVYQLIRKAVEASPGANVAVSTRNGEAYYSVPIREVVLSKSGTLLILIDSAGPAERSKEIP